MSNSMVPLPNSIPRRYATPSPGLAVRRRPFLVPSLRLLALRLKTWTSLGSMARCCAARLEAANRTTRAGMFIGAPLFLGSLVPRLCHIDTLATLHGRPNVYTGRRTWDAAARPFPHSGDLHEAALAGRHRRFARRARRVLSRDDRHRPQAIYDRY